MPRSAIKSASFGVMNAAVLGNKSRAQSLRTWIWFSKITTSSPRARSSSLSYLGERCAQRDQMVLCVPIAARRGFVGLCQNRQSNLGCCLRQNQQRNHCREYPRWSFGLYVWNDKFSDSYAYDADNRKGTGSVNPVPSAQGFVAPLCNKATSPSQTQSSRKGCRCQQV